MFVSGRSVLQLLAGTWQIKIEDMNMSTSFRDRNSAAIVSFTSRKQLNISGRYLTPQHFGGWKVKR